MLVPGDCRAAGSCTGNTVCTEEITYLAACVLPDSQHAILLRMQQLQIVWFSTSDHGCLDLIIPDSTKASMATIAQPMLVGHTPPATRRWKALSIVMLYEDQTRTASTWPRDSTGHMAHLGQTRSPVLSQKVADEQWAFTEPRHPPRTVSAYQSTLKVLSLPLLDLKPFGGLGGIPPAGHAHCSKQYKHTENRPLQ